MLMADYQVQRHFVYERIAWTAQRQASPSAIVLRSAFDEVRLLRLDGPALPTEEQLASASELQLHDWLARSQREPRS